jgi:hypothetical protein
VGDAGDVIADLGPLISRPANHPLMPKNVVAYVDEAPAMRGGWIAYAVWPNTTGSPTIAFSTKWAVPPAPLTRSGQTIFVSNGLESSSLMAQPVLQWGRSAAGGGEYWGIASWCIAGQGSQAFFSNLVRVEPGDTVCGTLTLAEESDGYFGYECKFSGVEETELSIANVDEFVWGSITLEAYEMTRCSDYPDTATTEMESISINTRAGSPKVLWVPVDGVTDCGQSISIVSGSATDGRIDLRYHGWMDEDLSAACDVSEPAAESAVSGYRASDGSRHVNFIDRGGQIHQLSWSATTGWAQSDLSAVSPVVQAAIGSSICGYEGNDGSQHVNFIDRNGHVHDLSCSRGGSWLDRDLTAQSGAATTASKESVAGYCAPDGSLCVYFVSQNEHIHELFAHPGHVLVDDDLTVASGGVSALGGGCILGWCGIGGSRHVNFVGADGHIYELRWESERGWVENNLTAASGTISEAASAALAGYRGTDGSQHVNFIDRDGHVRQLCWTQQSGWGHIDLTAVSGGVPAAAESSLGGYWGSESSRGLDTNQHVNFVDRRGHVHELYVRPGVKWVDNDLTAISGGAQAAVGSAMCSYWGGDGSQHVSFIDEAGDVHELCIRP